MVSKRGAAHFEMVLSFVLFVSFVFFLLIFIRPYQTNTLSGSVVAALYDSVEGEVTTNLTSVFLKADASALTSDCFSVNLPLGPFKFTLTDSVVKNLGDSEVPSEIGSGGDLEIKGDDIFYSVLISPDFDDDDLSGCDDLSNFVLGSLIEREVVSYSALESLKLRYDDDDSYEDLKEDLNFPETFDFAIVSETLPEISMERLVPSNEEVQATEYLSEVLYKNGTIVNAKFIFEVW